MTSSISVVEFPFNGRLLGVDDASRFNVDDEGDGDDSACCCDEVGSEGIPMEKEMEGVES